MRKSFRRPFVGLRAIARLLLVSLFVSNCKSRGVLSGAKYRLAPAKQLVEAPMAVGPSVSFAPIDFALGYDAIAFSGSRSESRELKAVVASLAKCLVSQQRVFVGCASGVDATVRDLCSWAEVFSVASGQWGTGVAAYARRSVAVLDALQASGSSHLLVAFPSGSAPRDLRPSKRWVSASGSGTWGTVAVAVGRGIPCLLFAAYLPVGGWGFKNLAGSWWFFSGGSSSSESEIEQLSLFF